MRYLLTVWPLAGHVNPFVSVATELRARGHGVAFYTGETARPLLEGEGFTVFPFQWEDQSFRDWTVAAAKALPAHRSPLGKNLRIYKTVTVDTIPGQVD